MKWLRLIAGSFAGIGALILIYQGETPAGVGILGTMLGFFVGEYNGQKETKKQDFNLPE